MEDHVIVENANVQDNILVANVNLLLDVIIIHTLQDNNQKSMFAEFVVEMEHLVWDVMEFHLDFKKIVAEFVVEMDHLASLIAIFHTHVLNVQEPLDAFGVILQNLAK